MPLCSKADESVMTFNNPTNSRIRVRASSFQGMCGSFERCPQWNMARVHRRISIDGFLGCHECGFKRENRNFFEDFIEKESFRQGRTQRHLHPILTAIEVFLTYLHLNLGCYKLIFHIRHCWNLKKNSTNFWFWDN